MNITITVNGIGQHLVQTDVGSAVITRVYDRHTDVHDWEIETSFERQRTLLLYENATLEDAIARVTTLAERRAAWLADNPPEDDAFRKWSAPWGALTSPRV